MDSRIVRENFDRGEGWREFDEISGERTTVLSCRHCSWRDEEGDASRVEARAWKHLESDHPEVLRP
jgi:hypothetical protein